MDNRDGGYGSAGAAIPLRVARGLRLLLAHRTTWCGLEIGIVSLSPTTGTNPRRHAVSAGDDGHCAHTTGVDEKIAEYRLIMCTGNGGLSWPTCASVTAARSPTLTASWPTAQPGAVPAAHGGSADSWGLRDPPRRHQDAVLPKGYPVGTSEEALDCACGLYL